MISSAAGEAKRRVHLCIPSGPRFQSGWWFSTTGIRRHDSGICPKIKELSFGGPSAVTPAVKVNGMIRALFTSSAMIAMSLSVLAQAPAPPPAPGATPDANVNAQDPATASRAVARISVLNGVVSVRRGDSGEAVAAAVNAPLTGTDRLLTGEGSRA